MKQRATPQKSSALQKQQTRRVQTERKLALNVQRGLPAAERHRGKRSASANFSPAGRSSRVGIDEIVQGIALLVGRKADVAAVGEEQHGWCRARRRRNRAWWDSSRPRTRPREPSPHRRGEIRPSNGSRECRLRSCPRAAGNRFQNGPNAGGTHHADEKRMEIGAVAALCRASPDGVAAAPAFAGFVIAHGGEDVIVNVAGFLDGGWYRRRYALWQAPRWCR